MRLLSYNIHKAVGGRDRRYSLERILKVIDETQPDLICLQEVARQSKRSRYHDQPSLIEEHFEAAGRLFQLNVNWREGGYGNLLLSRWPLETHHQISLRLYNKKPRGAQLAVINTPEGPLHLVNIHLGLAEAERHWQIKHLLGHGTFREASHVPTIIAGDSNDWRNTLLKSTFTEHGFEHLTAPPGRYRTFPAYLPMGSLDKAFCRGDVKLREVKIPRTALTRAASDHLPLVVDFDLQAAGKHS